MTQLQHDLWITNEHDLLIADLRDKERAIHLEDDEFQSILDTGEMHPLMALAIQAAD